MAVRASVEHPVRERFAAGLRALRTYGGENRFLVVMTDGDRGSPDERRAQMGAKEACRHGDRVAIILPCRKLESWIEWLDGAFEGERADYKPRYRTYKPTKRGRNTTDACGSGDLQVMAYSQAADPMGNRDRIREIAATAGFESTTLTPVMENQRPKAPSNGLAP